MKRKLRNKLTVNSRQLTTSARTLTFLVLSLMFMFIACTNGDTAHEHETYTCPMHPTVISDRPGTCPVCGMDLVRKARAGEEVEITEDLSRLIKSPNETVVASIKSIKGEYKSIAVTVPARGIVTYDTRNIYTIPARVSGRVEKIYLTYTFQQVRKGDKVADIYSPELIAAQRELLFLAENDPNNQSLKDAARKKLHLLGMSAAQITDLIKRKSTRNTFTVYSPYSGYLITGQQGTSTSAVSSPATGAGAAMNDGMGAGSSPASVKQGSQNTQYGSLIREGNYVNAGQTMFTIVNNNALRIELDLPGSLGGNVRKGSVVTLDFGSGNPSRATVDLVQPFFAEGQDFLKIRLYTKETEKLHIGHLVNAEIRLDSTEALWVPKEAVLDLGLQEVVFVKERGVYKPSEVITGISAEGLIEIKKGLASSEEIAANAHYLVDSESFVRPVE